MDMGSNDKSEAEKMNEDLINYRSSNMSSDWQFGGNSLMNSSMGLIPKGGLMESSSGSSASMVDSFCPPSWDRSTSSHNLGFRNISNQSNASISNIIGIGKANLGPFRAGIERTVDMDWTTAHSMLKDGIFPPSASAMLPQSLPPFPAHSGLIEQAARFSCFTGGNFRDMLSPFSFPESASPYSGGAPMMQGAQNGLAGHGLKSLSGGQSRNNEEKMDEASKDFGSPIEHRFTNERALSDERENENFVKSHDEANQGVGLSGNESDEAKFRGDVGQEEPSMSDGTCGDPSSSKGLGSTKRKRRGQDTGLNQVKEAPRPPEIPQKGDQNPASTTNRPSGKQSKQGSQASDSTKEEYLHMRARRGQATNSHSLAERVRREKISERMKFLQDIVPGCSKVTGKAVMLDEIINYVQSLQRQVEFLSMKLSTVNPRLDFNIDGLLAKDGSEHNQILQSQATPSAPGFSPMTSIPFPLAHLSQPGLIQAGIPGVANLPDALRRTINSQLTTRSGGYTEPAQVPHAWEDELNNVIQMGFNSGEPDDSGSPPPSNMKVEP